MGGRLRLIPKTRDLVELGLCHAPQSLLGREALDRLARIDCSLPAVAHTGAFEVRLGTGDDGSVVDFELAIGASRHHFESLRSFLTSRAAMTARDRSPGWATTLDFLERWSNPEEAISREIKSIWIEFDTGDVVPGTSEEPSPFVIATLDRERFYPDGLANRRHLEETIHQVLVAQGAGSRTSIPRQIRDFLDRLPAFAQVLHVARRPSAGSDLLRLIVVFPWERIVESLVRLGWTGPAGELSALLEALPHATMAHSVDLDLAPDGLQPQIGIEFHYPSAPARDPRWRDLLDFLQQENACTNERRRQIEDWGEGDPETEEGEGREERFRVVRQMLVKVVHDPGRPLRAKAYLPYHIEIVRPEPVRSRAAPHDLH